MRLPLESTKFLFVSAKIEQSKSKRFESIVYWNALNGASHPMILCVFVCVCRQWKCAVNQW